MATEFGQEFGGQWTRLKLECLSKYLSAYMHIFKNQNWAKTYYVDAFAGSGYINVKSENFDPTEDSIDDEFAGFIQGSTRVALRIEPAFHEYLFVDRSSKNIIQLQNLKVEFSKLADRIYIQHGDANFVLSDWISSMKSNDRAVVFLDPFGMQVKWSLIQTIAKTKQIDLWILVPIGIGVNRMMTKQGLPPTGWQNKLNDFFGTEEWQSKFYASPAQKSLFDDGPTEERRGNYEALSSYFIQRLKEVFGEDNVARNPYTQRNKKNSPLFMLCFAASNKTGVKIAQDLLTNLSLSSAKG